MAKKTTRSRATTLTELPALPVIAITRDGFEFRTDDEIWSLCSHTSVIYMNFSSIEGVTNEFSHSLKLVVLWYLQNNATMHARNIYQRFVHFIRFLAQSQKGIIECLSAADILNYKASLQRDNEWYLATIAGALKQWHALGYPGVDSEAIRLFAGMRLHGNIKGEAVMTMDPRKGPFSDIEFEGIQSAANEAYARGILSLEEYVLIWLFIALGARPVQYASLKIKDFVVMTDEDGFAIHTLQVPRAKQRCTPIRAEFKERSLIPQIGELLASHIESVRAAYSGRLADHNELPIFPRHREANDIPGFAFHTNGSNLNLWLKTALAKLAVISERTGEPMEISSRRFRYTLGTRAAMEGAGELVIAEILDHSDTQNSGIYVECRPEIVERIDKALALQLVPMAQAFCGILIENEGQATRGDDPTSRIIDPLADQARHPVGNCGRHGFCGFAAPIACYTCSNFQPWLDGPHEAVLERLIEERDSIVERGGDLRIASVNDRIILAVGDVVLRCREMKAAMEAV